MSDTPANLRSGNPIRPSVLPKRSPQQPRKKITVADVIAAQGNLCRYCDQPVELRQAAITHSYWQGIPFICHWDCRDAGLRQEAHDCQVIDADCNDCKHFKRGQLVPHPPHIQAAIDRGDVPGFTSEVFSGHCLKFDRPTFAFPNKWTGRECFEHRRSL